MRLKKRRQILPLDGPGISPMFAVLLGDEAPKFANPGYYVNGSHIRNCIIYQYPTMEKCLFKFGKTDIASVAKLRNVFIY